MFREQRDKSLAGFKQDNERQGSAVLQLQPAWPLTGMSALPFSRPLSSFWGLCPYAPTMALASYLLSSSLMGFHEIFLKYWCQMNFLETTVGQTSLLTQDHNRFVTERNSNSVCYIHNLTYFRLGIFMTKPYLLPKSSPSAFSFLFCSVAPPTTLGLKPAVGPCFSSFLS